MNPKANLILIPTPIEDETHLVPETFELLNKAAEQEDLIVVEEHKTGRRRWLHWGLPREAIDRFVLLNEHTDEREKLDLLSQMKKGKKVYLLSDCGLPAFCDPGQDLVDLCHHHRLIVTSAPFPNSTLLALVLSGYPNKSYRFAGFPPREKGERKEFLQKALAQKEATILMDAPFRLNKILEEIADLDPERELFLGLDLNMKQEELLRYKSLKMVKSCPKSKREFVIVLAPL
jgi:16S rRNA (cytidine1402-2'-O)-methyltransferase